VLFIRAYVDKHYEAWLLVAYGLVTGRCDVVDILILVIVFVVFASIIGNQMAMLKTLRSMDETLKEIRDNTVKVEDGRK